MKPAKRIKTILLIPAVILLLIVFGVFAGYRYLMSDMERDRFVPPEELGIADTSNIIRETMPETTENGILDEEGNMSSFRLPEEALAVLRGESEGTGITVSDTTAETEEELVSIETEPETETISAPETETIPETEKEIETKAETKPETVKETRPAETKPQNTTLQVGTSTSYLKPGAEKIKTFVLYGLDEKKASDVIILAALDPVHNKCKIISIARDTYTYLSDRKAHTKMNYAFSLGGAPLAVKALNENLYLHLEDYIAVDYTQASTVIDLLGGASVDLDEIELAYMGFPWGSEPGTYTLTGEQAVNYARLREMDNDLKRNDRQREVIKSVFSNFRTLKVTDYPALFRKAAGMCTTSFTDTELLSLGTTFLSMKGCTFEQYSYPNANTHCWGGLIDEVFYWVYDLAKVSDEIYRIIYEDLYVSGYTENS